MFCLYFFGYCVHVCRDLGVPAVRTRGLLLLEARISQEVDKAARAHQVSIGTLWGKRKVEARVKESVSGKWKKKKQTTVDLKVKQDMGK